PLKERVASEQGQADNSVAPVHIKRLLHKSLVLHFMVLLSLGEDADPRLAMRSMGRVHHRILYFAHFAPGITVSELLKVLGVKHQNIQAPLRQLISEGYILSRASQHDGRVKQLYCSRKGDKLLEFISAGQRERLQRGYDGVTPQDVESYFKVMLAMLGPDRREWAHRLTALDDPTESV
ncbi:MAG: MarR family winged helix-turn-helix transcriptional regulator, partial [Burkholderiaceae bacterium]